MYRYISKQLVATKRKVLTESAQKIQNFARVIFAQTRLEKLRMAKASVVEVPGPEADEESIASLETSDSTTQRDMIRFRLREAMKKQSKSIDSLVRALGVWTQEIR